MVHGEPGCRATVADLRGGHMFDLRRVGLSCRAVLLVGTVGCLVGCMHALQMSVRDMRIVAQPYVVDSTGPDSYSSAAAGEATTSMHAATASRSNARRSSIHPRLPCWKLFGPANGRISRAVTSYCIVSTIAASSSCRRLAA